MTYLRRALPVLIAVTLVSATLFPVTTHAYADRRTYKFGEGKRVIHRYSVDEAYLVPTAKATYHCIYFATNGRCEAVAKEYRNVRTPKIISHDAYLDVQPTAVSPRAPRRLPLYLQPRSSSDLRYVEFAPARNVYR